MISTNVKSALWFLVISVCCSAQDTKLRVYVSDSNSWETSGGFSGSSGHFSGGARPQTVEVIKTFRQRCPGVTVTMDKSKADYVVLFDRDGGKGIARRRDKIAVFRRDADLLYSESTRSVGSAVQDSCGRIEKQFYNDAARTVTASQPQTTALQPRTDTPNTPQPVSAPVDVVVQPAAQTKPAEVIHTEPVQAAEKAQLTITSNPTGAGVEINGVPVGTTPVTVSLPKGTSFTLTVKRDGFFPWGTESVAVAGHHTVNAALSKVMVYQ